MSISVSVIVPVYKAEKYIVRCATSLFEQNFDDIEYIFVDDIGGDNSMRLLHETISLFPQRQNQVHIITQPENLGNATARNSGLKIARGEFIIQIDSDDWVEPNMISLMYEKAALTNADIVCCNCVEEYDSFKKYYSFSSELSKDQMIRMMPANLLYSSLWNKLIKKSLFSDNNISCFDNTNNWVDIGLIIRLVFFAEKLAFVHETLYHYNRFNENSVSIKPNLRRINDMLTTTDEIIRFFKKNGSYDKFVLPLNYLQYLAKDRLLYDKNLRDFKRWKSLYPDTHRFIWKYPQLTLFKRVSFSLAALGFKHLSCSLLDIRASLSKFM